MKPGYIIAFTIILIFSIVSRVYLFPRLKIITGYAAKSMCSCVFVAKREPGTVLNGDLNFSFLQYANAWANKDENTAYATIFGLAKSKAIYRKGIGCTLITSKEGPTLTKNRIQLPDKPTAPPESKAMEWPYGDVVKDSSFSEIDYSLLTKAVDNAFDVGDGHIKNTRALLIVYKNHIVAEKYAPGFDASTPQLGWSMTKSVTGALAGILVKQNKLNLDQKSLFKEWKQDDRKEISLRNLLNMNSGLKWNEEYGDMSDATIMLYRHSDMTSYAINRPLISNPGTTWVYSSGTSNIIQQLIKNSFSSVGDYLSFPYQELFSKIGMYSATFETDENYAYIGSSYLYANARDWAKFGLLYLHDGVWNGERILPEGWVGFTREVAPGSGGNYGGHVWLNEGNAYPSAPKDMFRCQGFHGQFVFIFPKQDLVIVRLGVSKLGTFNYDDMLKQILGAFSLSETKKTYD